MKPIIKEIEITTTKKIYITSTGIECRSFDEWAIEETKSINKKWEESGRCLTLDGYPCSISDAVFLIINDDYEYDELYEFHELIEDYTIGQRPLEYPLILKWDSELEVFNNISFLKNILG